MFRRFRPSLSIILPLIILSILALSYRDVIRSMVLVPLAYFIFIFRLIAGGIGQETIWISFVVFSTIIAVFSLALRKNNKTREITAEHKYPTRLQIWITAIQRKEHSQYFKWQLAQDLGKLLIEALAYRQGISPDQVQNELQSGKLDLPSEIREYLKISQKPFAQTGLAHHPKGNWFSKIWITKFKQSTPRNNHSPLDVNYEKIIVHLQECLNVDTDIWEG